MKTLIVPFLLFLMTFISCRQNDEMLEKKTNSYDVYVLGLENAELAYWKNNIKTILPNGNNLIPGKIIVENNNIYATAATEFSKIDYFWKNGIKNDILQYLNISSSVDSKIHDFKVENNDIYFSGYVENPTAPASERYEICYWKNSVKTILDKKPYIVKTAVDVVNSKVYTISYKNIYTGNELGYYENNTYHLIDNETSIVRNMIHNSSGVYVLLVRDAKLFQYNLITHTLSFIGTYQHPVATQGEIAMDPSNNNLYASYEMESYYKNDIKLTSPNYEYVKSIKAYDDNLFMLVNTENVNHANKLLINNVEVQSIAPNSGIFTSLFVVKN